jgi:ketosteroid isomerase-like protein
VHDDFRQRLAVAYDEWAASRGTTPAAFFDLMDPAIEFHSVLEREFPCDPLSGPFIGKAAVIAYWTAIAESCEMIASMSVAMIAEGDRCVWTGWVRWRHRRTLRELETPKIDIWTVWQGRAIRYFEMIDSASYERAVGSFDRTPQDA